MTLNSGGLRMSKVQFIRDWPLLNLSNVFDYELVIGSYTNVDYFGRKYYYYPLRILSDEFLHVYNPTVPAKDFLDDIWFLKYFVESFKEEIYGHY